jgi:hypothetical protein
MGVQSGASRMLICLNSRDLYVLSIKWVVIVVSLSQDPRDHALSRPGTESSQVLGTQPLSMVRADGRLAPPSSLALRSHPQPPTRVGHIGTLGLQAHVC